MPLLVLSLCLLARSCYPPQQNITVCQIKCWHLKHVFWAPPCFAGGSYVGMLVRAAVSRQASSKQGTSSSEPGTC